MEKPGTTQGNEPVPSADGGGAVAHARPQRTFVWELARAILLEYFGVFHAVRYRCRGNIPAHGPVILAPNHISYYDPPLVGAGVPRQIRSMAWDVLFRVPGLAWLMRAYGAYPVRIKTADKRAVAQTLAILRAGGCVMVFPEGLRGHTGELGSFEQGVARVAIQTGAVVVPVTITGCYEAYNRHDRFPHWFRPIQVKYHPPVAVHAARGREELRQEIDRINAAVAAPIRRRLAAWQRLRRRSPKRSA